MGLPENQYKAPTAAKPNRILHTSCSIASILMRLRILFLARESPLLMVFPDIVDDIPANAKMPGCISVAKRKPSQSADCLSVHFFSNTLRTQNQN